MLIQKSTDLQKFRGDIILFFYRNFSLPGQNLCDQTVQQFIFQQLSVTGTIFLQDQYLLQDGLKIGRAVRMKDRSLLVTGKISMISGHCSSVKMYPQESPGIVLAAFVSIRFLTIQKDMIAWTDFPEVLSDSDCSAAGQYNKEKIGFQMGPTADMTVPTLEPSSFLNIQKILTGK